MDLDIYNFESEEIASGICEWASIESPTYNANSVNKMMDLAESLTRDMGADIVRTPGSGGYGDALQSSFRFEHSSETAGILILGHLDTVHLEGTTSKELPIRREGDKLFGPGVFDMKGGMYMACHVVKKILELKGNLRLPISFLFIPDEEIGSPSTRNLIEEVAQSHRYVLVPEPARPGKLITGRHSFLRYIVHVYGKPAHAGVAKGVGRSAISVMAKLIEQIENYSDVTKEITYRVGNINGGTFVNVIPTECHAEVLCVAPNREAVRDIQNYMGSIESPDSDVRVEIETGPIRPLFQKSEGNMELFEIARNVAAEIGLKLDHGQFGGGSDGNFTGALGIPTLDGLGVEGDSHHTKSEHLLISSLVTRAKLFTGLLTVLADRSSY
jgi:glutamate carboxypeptidase